MFKIKHLVRKPTLVQTLEEGRGPSESAGQLWLGRASGLTLPSGGRRPAPEAEDQTPLGLGSKAWEASPGTGFLPGSGSGSVLRVAGAAPRKVSQAPPCRILPQGSPLTGPLGALKTGQPIRDSGYRSPGQRQRRREADLSPGVRLLSLGVGGQGESRCPPAPTTGRSTRQSGGGGQAGIREGDGHSSDHVGLEATWGA